VAVFSADYFLQLINKYLLCGPSIIRILLEILPHFSSLVLSSRHYFEQKFMHAIIEILLFLSLLLHTGICVIIIARIYILDTIIMYLLLTIIAYFA